MTHEHASWPLGHIWKSKAELARDLGEPEGTVWPWFSKGRRIPPARFGQIIEAAARRGHTLGWKDLSAIGAVAAPVEASVASASLDGGAAPTAEDAA